MKDTPELVEKVRRAIWLTETTEGWDDGTGIEKRMNLHSGLLCSAEDYDEAARAAIQAMIEFLPEDER